MRGLGFTIDVERLAGGRLHPCGEAKVGDPCLEFQLALSL